MIPGGGKRSRPLITQERAQCFGLSSETMIKGNNLEDIRSLGSLSRDKPREELQSCRRHKPAGIRVSDYQYLSSMLDRLSYNVVLNRKIFLLSFPFDEYHNINIFLKMTRRLRLPERKFSPRKQSSKLMIFRGSLSEEM